MDRDPKAPTRPDAPPVSRLLAFARELQRAATFGELLSIARTEVETALGYGNAWLLVADDEKVEELRLIDVAGSQSGTVWEVVPVLTVKGDAMLEEIVRSDVPVVVLDARTDPRTDKKIVAQLQNRTIINVPLRLLDKPFGAFGIGTFGDVEGCRPPTREQLDYLVGMASQLSVAAGRIRFLEERKRAAAALSRSQEQLRQAQKMDAVGRLAGGVAHDFNNMLSVILSYSTMLFETLESTDPNRDDVAQIKLAGERARDLTRQLLAFSRQQVLVPEVLDVNDVLAHMQKMLERVMREDIQLTLLPGAKRGHVKADPGQVEQILMNLAVNARDAMPGGGRLTIETSDALIDEAHVRSHVGVSPGPYVLLAVSDTGIGMDKETQTRIFEPFFTTKGAGEGTGLGLSTVFGIVHQSGGTIWVYSEPGVGTTFKIYLPRCDEDPTERHDVAPVTTSLQGTETVLLVEDEEQVRLVARTILRRAGYHVIEASGSGQALLAAEQYRGRIHLLLSDVIMPQIGGPELADRLSVARPEMKVLYMSGYTDNVVIHHGLVDSTIAFVQKPLTPALLLGKVRWALDRPSRTIQPSRPPIQHVGNGTSS